MTSLRSVECNQTLTDNTMENSGVFIEGNTLQRWNTHVIDTSNTINGKPIYYWKDRSGGTVPGDAGQVLLANCTDIYIKNLIFSNASVGIQLGYSHGNEITNNIASHNKIDGINLYRSNNNSITDSTFSNNRGIGIFLWRSDGNIVSGNILSQNHDHGILIWDNSNHNNVSGNVVSNSFEWSIYLYRSDNNTVSENTVSSNDYQGIFLELSSKSTLFNNHMDKSGISINGFELIHWNTHTIDTSNMVNGKPVYYWNNRIGGTVPEGAGQVILANCTNVVVEGQNFIRVTTGVSVGFSTFCNIRNNIAIDNKEGIQLTSSNNNTISSNVVSRNQYGIRLTSFYIFTSNMYNTIVNNTVTFNNKSGIHLSHLSMHNTIVHNTVTSNNGYGIYISSISTDNQIVNNTIAFNTGYGISVRGTENLIYHNLFIYNESQAQGIDRHYWDAGDPAEGGKGGNYWSDYEGKDRGDGIGDVPYDIYPHYWWNKDRYPWTNPHFEHPPAAGSFFSLIKNMVAGDHPEILIIHAMDTDGEFLNGEFDVTVEIDDKEVSMNAMFNAGHAVLQLETFNLTKAGSYTAFTTLNDVTNTNLFYVIHGEMDYIKVVPEEITITAGDNITYAATLHDKYGNEIRDVSKFTEWSVDAGGFWSKNEYSSEFAGTWNVTGRYENAEGTATLVVKPASTKTVIIDPQGDLTIVKGETIKFTAAAYDRFGNLITDNVTDFIWYNADENGVFDKENTGFYDITATYEEVTSDPTTVKVETFWSNNWSLFVLATAVLITAYVLLEKRPKKPDEEQPIVKYVDPERSDVT